MLAMMVPPPRLESVRQRVPKLELKLVETSPQQKFAIPRNEQITRPAANF